MKILSTLVTENGTKVVKAIEDHQSFKRLHKTVTLPENSKLRKAGIDEFRFTRDTDDNAKSLVALRGGSDIASGFDNVRELISVLKKFGDAFTIHNNPDVIRKFFT